MNSKFYIDVSLNLIQSIRLLQFLMESDYTICVPTEYEDLLLYLKDFFDVKYCLRTSKFDCKKIDVEILHEAPKTRIGTIERPLIFPHGAFKYCKNLWGDSRKNKFAFAGLLSENRRFVIGNWIQENWPTYKYKFLSDNDIYLNKVILNLKRILFNRVNFFEAPHYSLKKYGDFVVWSSNRGRCLPTKIWDPSYFNFLADSQFVLCPDGDFVWTYRFFEAIMCGAIPIIQNYSPIYEGFKFKRMNSSIENMVWNEDDAESNFCLCKERLTVPVDDINIELASLLTDALS
jgi:hypothetical protein